MKRSKRKSFSIIAYQKNVIGFYHASFSMTWIKSVKLLFFSVIQKGSAEPAGSQLLFNLFALKHKVKKKRKTVPSAKTYSESSANQSSNYT